MKGIAITPRLCDQCGEPAQYTDARMTDNCWDACEECARDQGAAANGKACAAFDTFGFAIGMARDAGLSDAQIRQAFDDVLTDPVGYSTYDTGGDRVLGRDRREDRSWQRIFGELQP